MNPIEFVILLSILIILLWALNRVSKKSGKNRKGPRSVGINRPVSRWEAGRRTVESYSKNEGITKNYWSIRGGTANNHFGKVTQHSKEGTSWHGINNNYKK